MTATGIFIALGSNLGRRAETLSGALMAISAWRDVRVLAVSSFHETEAVGGPLDQPRFLNAAAKLDTTLSPHALLRRLQALEQAFGRRRGQPDGPRTLDLDLLAYHDLQMCDTALTLPHPRMWERPFVLAPLSEIAEIERLRRAIRRVEPPRLSAAPRV